MQAGAFWLRAVPSRAVWICLCEAVTSSTIRETIAAGAATVDDVGRECAAGTVCGKCRRNIAVLLAEAGKQPSKKGRRPWRTTQTS
jgi:bacterioferritin-associated ferredoxin